MLFDGNFVSPEALHKLFNRADENPIAEASFFFFKANYNSLFDLRVLLFKSNKTVEVVFPNAIGSLYFDC
jgi:hypothetical protein